MPDCTSIEMADGRRVTVPVPIADDVLGVDADGDLVVAVGTPENPIRHDDGSEYLAALTPCCSATGTGSCVGGAAAVVCRGCHSQVGAKFARHTRIAVHSAHRHARPRRLLPPAVLRAVEVAAAGAHHVLLEHDDGSEFPLPARWLYHLLPDRTGAQQMDAAVIERAVTSGDSRSRGDGVKLLSVPPLRRISAETSVGQVHGGRTAGECSRAHGGLLVLSDMDRCSVPLLDAVGHVASHREVRTSSGSRVYHHPADVVLCALARPAPPRPAAAARLRLLDRLDVRLTTAPAVDHRPLHPGGSPDPDDTTRIGGGLAAARDRVIRARNRAARRWSVHCSPHSPGPLTNAAVPADELYRTCSVPAVLDPIDRLVAAGALTDRGAAAVLRLAYTVADLDGVALAPRHVDEALHLRQTA